MYLCNDSNFAVRSSRFDVRDLRFEVIPPVTYVTLCTYVPMYLCNNSKFEACLPLVNSRFAVCSLRFSVGRFNKFQD